jgi:RNA polymerase sigma factor (sigma-70 family)
MDRTADQRETEAVRPTSPEVVAALVENHRDFLRFVERRVGDRAAAEDILQQAFVRGLERAEGVPEDSVVAWFYRVLRNAVVDHFRRRGASARALEAVAAELDAEEGTPSPDTRDAICQCVRRVAATLKPEYAAALQRVEVDGLAVQAFAAEAGITANNAAVRVHRAREALRRQVRISCGTCAEHGCLDCGCGKRERGGP